MRDSLKESGCDTRVSQRSITPKDVNVDTTALDYEGTAVIQIESRSGEERVNQSSNLYETGKGVHPEDIAHSPVTISLSRSSHRRRQTINEQREPRRRGPCSDDDRLLHTRAFRASTRQQFEAMIAQAAGQEYTFLAKASTPAAYPSTTQTMCRSRCHGSLLAHCRAVLRRLSFLATQSR